MGPLETNLCTHSAGGAGGAIITTAQECADAIAKVGAGASGPYGTVGGTLPGTAIGPAPSPAAAAATSAAATDKPPGCYLEGTAKFNPTTTSTQACSATLKCYCLQTKTSAAPATGKEWKGSVVANTCTHTSIVGGALIADAQACADAVAAIATDNAAAGTTVVTTSSSGRIATAAAASAAATDKPAGCYTVSGVAKFNPTSTSAHACDSTTPCVCIRTLVTGAPTAAPTNATANSTGTAPGTTTTSGVDKLCLSLSAMAVTLFALRH